MSATNTLETAVLKYLLEGVSDAAWTAIAAATDLYVSLHTADPGDAGSQTTSETAYTGYERQAVVRDAAGWTATGGSSVNDANVTFPVCSASPGADITHIGIGLDETGAGTLLLTGALDSPIDMQTGAEPRFTAGDLEVTCE